MKKNWQQLKVRDISKMKNGKSRPSSEGNYPVYGGNGIMNYCDSFNAEDVIIVGRVGVYCGNVYCHKSKCWVSDNAIAVTATEQTENIFLYYLLSNLDLHHKRIGAAQPLMTQDIIGDFDILLPPLPTQRKIASVLSALDDKIENNNAICLNLEEQARVLYKHYTKKSTIEVPFFSLLKLSGGGTPSTRNVEYWGDEIPLFTPKDVNYPFTYTTEKFITQKGLSACNSQLFPKGTTFITARGTVGKISMAGIPMAMNQSCYAISSDFVNPILTYFYSTSVVSSLQKKASGSVFDAIVTRDFETEFIRRMSPTNEGLFSHVANAIFDQIDSLGQENIKLSTLRDTLLPKLMRGEIDVDKVVLPD